jgi:branched-chain amino acid transport system permease protein
MGGLATPPARGLPVALLAAPVLAGLGALVFGWFCIRLSGVYLAMLTLAFSQIVWSVVFQWDAVTGGSNGIFGAWPQAPFDSRAGFYLLECAASQLASLQADAVIRHDRDHCRIEEPCDFECIEQLSN